MGCFNRTGFYSHLPITYGDDIVMFMCADTSNLYGKSDSCPISVVGSGYTPLAFPFFGEYDDYGGIEKVVDDANSQFFTKATGVTFEEFCKLMHDMDGVTIAHLRERVQYFTDHPEEEKDYEWGLYNKKQCEKLLKIFEGIIAFDISEIENPHPEVKELSDIYERMHKRDVERHDNVSIILTMEHRSVYEKMVEVGKQHIFDHWFGGDEKVTPEEAFDNTAKDIMNGERKTDRFGNDNPFHDGVGVLTRVDMNRRIGIKICLHDTVHVDELDYALYGSMKGDISAFKDIVTDYAYFLNTLSYANVTFDVSPYHSQTVAYDQLLPIYEKMVEIIKKRLKEEEEDS